MRLSVSAARPQLGHLCTLAQDPRAVIVLTRHGKDLAAIVSVEEVKRIWHLQDTAWGGPKSLLSGRPKGGALILPQHLVAGPNSQVITKREAAEIIRHRQLTRAEERRLLEEGGLEPVPGGEVAGTVPVRLPLWRRMLVSGLALALHRRA